MPISYILSTFITFVLILLAMAFFTLLERKILGYIQIRKGPNKVGIMGLPQPFADALKLFAKEQAHPSMTNYTPFYFAPMLSLILALLLWALYPTNTPSLLLPFGILLFLCISSLNVYSTLAAGWSSNSKYSLIGALRGIAQTISYEVSMSLILLTALLTFNTYNFLTPSFNSLVPATILLFPMAILWFITMLAETNRTPFDLAEGESELVSGFNTEYSSGPFALIFMAEYTSILAMSMFTSALFTSSYLYMMSDLYFAIKTLMIAVLFIWVRGTLPRMRYDRLMALTWKSFLPSVIALITFIVPIMAVM
uniref:NADH-ubiquinone oxidoreductase chain 1 n=1 Tax=Prionospio sanmartini TaxID=3050092 RepID=A0AAU6QG62_9ANNE